ncbi:SpoIIE family protein phosphatase [Candidatus Eisenbacteria bacterium]|uniref:SpoIIE family protein phosphatase n=1 Tax=Eiseniibacteriota bacterium TaxID=2212470 RepID=A0ABV6YN06_UNCEI
MPEPIQPIRDQLTDRRAKLEQALGGSPGDTHLSSLLAKVDAALERMDTGTYGLCETCKEPIEPDRLLADPLVCYCLDDMTPDEQRALEEDLELARRIQGGLLPGPSLRVSGWEVVYHYEGAGPISGDYCDYLTSGKDLYFVVGDVSGKGVAASMLMAHLHATFRILVSLNLPLDQIVERASRMFCESTLPTYFATLVCGKAHDDGDVEICNAGHNPPLVIKGSKLAGIDATGLPLGMFCEERFSITRVHLGAGDGLLIYTDGLSEALNRSDEQYGAERLSKVVSKNHAMSPQGLISVCVEDVNTFRAGAPRSDDLTIMVVRRLG